MAQKGKKQTPITAEQVLAPRIYPLGWVLKFDPPVIGLLYKRNPKEKKKHLYQIHLNNLIFLTNAEDITMQIFFEHPLFLNPQFVKPDQSQTKVHGLVMRLLEYKNQRLREMAKFMDEYDEQGEPNTNMEQYQQQQYEEEDEEENYNDNGNDEEGSNNIDYENLNDEQLYQLYQEQMQQQQYQQAQQVQRIDNKRNPIQLQQQPKSKNNDVNKSF